MAQRNLNKRSGYKKDKKISIIQTIYTTDELGFEVEETAPLPGGENIWAYYRQATANEFYGAATVNYKVESIFKIGWRDDLHHDMKVLYKGKEYGITRIDDFEGYKQDLTIYAYVIV